MRRHVLIAGAFVLGLLLLFQGSAYAQKHNVTFWVNTATVPDTITPVTNVVVTGGCVNDTAANSLLTSWGSGVALTNVGGDYWTKTVQFAANDSLSFKLRIRGDGWEENTSASDGNRDIVIPAKDTVLKLEFWNNGHFPSGKNISLFDKPYTILADSFLNVYVRVNMKGVSDNALYGWTAPDVDSVGILGGGPTGSNHDWGTPLYMTLETGPTNSAGAFGMPPGSFYNTTLRIPKSQVTAGMDIAYKFRLGSNWSYGQTQRGEQLSGPNYGGGNRHFIIPQGLNDTTLQWVFFGDVNPTSRANTDTVTLTWRVDVTTARNKGSFNIGDTIQVQSGFFNTADSTRTVNLQRIGLTNIYTGSSTMVTALNNMLDYQYYLVKNGQTTRENFFNFQYAGEITAEAERRQFQLTTKTITVFDTANSVSSGRRQPYFQNQRQLAHGVTVLWTVDMRPAYYQVLAGDTLYDIQGSGANVAKVDSIARWGVAINGPATGGPDGPLPVDWATWNSFLTADTSARKMWDNGTHGDKTAGDSIYSITFHYTTANIVGQVFKFGIRGGDNESNFGLNHLENISDVDTAYEIDSQWGSINPNFYSAWDYDLHKPKTPTGISTLGGHPLVYKLEQNYPNPFNPTTRIEFSIPKQSNVELKVFNVLGQEVATLVQGVLPPGDHVATFDAKSFATGVYFYRIKAGEFLSVKKMLLLK